MSEARRFAFSNPKTQMQLFWLVIMAAAAFFRFANLGKLGLWGDEGYAALSAQAILRYGYPRLPSGGIYPRSLFFLYIEALSVRVFGLNEYGLRFPSAVIGLATILMSYKLSSRLLGKSVALAVVVLMAFSNWEIEFSRHARMYIFFQFSFLSSLYVFYRSYFDEKKWAQLAVIPVWAFTVFVHQLSISLAAVLLIPFFIRGLRLKRKCLLFPSLLGLGVLWVLEGRLQSYLRYATASLNPTAGTSSGGFKLPVAVPPLDLVDALALRSDNLFFAWIGFATALALFLVHKSLKQRKLRIAYLYLILIGGASCFGQIALALLLLVGYTFFFFKDTQSWRQTPFRISCSICIGGLFFWVIAGFSDGLHLRKVLSLILQYPDLRNRFLKYYLPGWPMEMFVASLGMLLLWKSAVLFRKKEVIFILLSFIGPVLMMGFAKAGDNSARYSFHLFPLLLMFEAYAIVYLGKKVIPKRRTQAISIAFLVLFFVRSDTSLAHLESLVGRSYGSSFERPIPMSRKSTTFYPDYKSTSDYIRTNASDGDIIISMRELIPFYYMQKIDYVWTGEIRGYFPPLLGDTRAASISVSKINSLLSAGTSQKLWLLSDPFRVAKLEKIGDELALSFLAQISGCRVYRGQDKKTTVYFMASDNNCLQK